MTIYGKFEEGWLKIKSNGLYSSGEWENLQMCKNKTEAKKEFIKHKTTYIPHWTSSIKWEG